MKILLIDSDDSYLTINSLWLKVIGKYQVYNIKVEGRFQIYSDKNVNDGINKFNEVKPGLIIIDVNIPGGLDIVRTLRKKGFKGLIVAYSVAKEEKFYKAGCDNFISKFADDNEFIEAVKRIIKERTPNRKSVKASKKT